MNWTTWFVEFLKILDPNVDTRYLPIGEIHELSFFVWFDFGINMREHGLSQQGSNWDELGLMQIAAYQVIV